MKTRRLLNRTTSLLGLSFLLLLAFAMAPLQAKPDQHRAHCGVSISATIWGSFTDFAWRGNALVQVGDAEPMLASFVDVSHGPPVEGKRGVLSGAETITMDFGGGNTFQIEGTFDAYPGPTPMLYLLDEVGTIKNGTGEFKDMVGSVSIRGPFVFPLLELGEDDAPPGWVAQMRGRVRLNSRE